MSTVLGRVAIGMAALAWLSVVVIAFIFGGIEAGVAAIVVGALLLLVRLTGLRGVRVLGGKDEDDTRS